MSIPIVSVRDVSKAYHLYANSCDRLRETLIPWRKRHKLFYALRDISFDINKGEHLGIIGVNGAGKSTLLQVITGVLTPTQGEVSVNGRVAALLELGAGFNMELTGRQNVAFLLSIFENGQYFDKKLIDRVIEFAGIGDFIDQPVKTYSSGMFVRLAFAVNMLSEPEILVIDEALAVGDIFFQQKCMRRMKEYREKGTILFVSHDVYTVKSLCNKVLWLEEGGQREFGIANEICDHYLANFHKKIGEEFVPTERNVDCQRSEIIKSPGEDSIVLENLGAIVTTEIQSGVIKKINRLISMTNYPLDVKESFGTKRAKIIDANLEILSKKGATQFRAGEKCRLSLFIFAFHEIEPGVAGFVIKDKIGQYVLGANSYDSNIIIDIDKNSIRCVLFDFTMPFLQSGFYSIDVAFAEGDLFKNRQCHWVYDALVFEVRHQEDRGTLIRLPIDNCSLI